MRAAAKRTSGTGLAVFMVADVRGYTAYTHARGDEAAAHLTARFAELARSCARAHGGRVVELRGDEVLAVFSSAREALKAAVALQASCADASSDELPLRIGIGLEAGEPVAVRGGYRGEALNVAARLCALAGAGEIVATEALVGLARKVDGLFFEPRGPVELKGLPAPVSAWSVRSFEHDPAPTSEPAALVPARRARTLAIIGRAEELAEIARLLADADRRLLTVTGPGGVGKTRLALVAAGRVADTFRDGARIVDLSAISDAGMVASAIAEAIDVAERPGRPLRATVADALREREMLLVLDNFEQVLAAAELVGSLLEACPGLRVLATSRQPLRLREERILVVPPLPLPPADTDDDQSGSPAVALFLERARAAGASLRTDTGGLRAIAAICRRLDGLPLAIELAATRTRHLPPSALLARLEPALPLLAHGPRDLPERQRTLTAAIAWSYDLLDGRERAMFCRSAVFVGGCTLEAAAAVASGDELENGGPVEAGGPLELLTALSDHSLLQVEEEPSGDVRFRQLETIREFAYERLRESGEATETRRRHAAYFRALAERAAPHLERADQSLWLDRLSRDHANLRAALRWAIDSGETDWGLRLAAELWPFWFMRGALTEGREWLTELLAAAGNEVDPGARAAALNAAGTLARYQRDYATAETLIAKALGIRRGLADAEATADSISNLAYITLHRGNHARARSLYEEALGTYRERGNEQGIADALSHLALIALHEADIPSARRLHQESLGIWRGLGDLQGVAWALDGLGNVELEAGEHAAALACFREGLEVARGLGHGWVIALLIDGFACLAAAQTQPVRALRLAGAAAALRARVGTPLTPFGERALHRWLARARLSIGSLRAQEAQAGGAALTSAEATAEALVPAGSEGSPPVGEPGRWSGLSKREREVAALVAEGLTNRHIAERLFIAEGTADRHVANILGKLEMRSRAQVAVWAAERGLLQTG